MQGEQRRSGSSIGSWMGAQFLFAIPLVNIIFWILWAITSKNRSRRNYCIAALIWLGIAIVAYVVASVFFRPQIVKWLLEINSNYLSGL